MAGGNLYLAPVILPNEVVIINIEANEARSFIASPDLAYESFVSSCLYRGNVHFTYDYLEASTNSHRTISA